MSERMFLAQRNTLDPKRRRPPWSPFAVDTVLSAGLQPRPARTKSKCLILFRFAWAEPRYRRRSARLGRTAIAAAALRQQGLHLAAVGLHPGDAGGHVDHQPVAAQHVLALRQDHAPEHGDQVGLGVE